MTHTTTYDTPPRMFHVLLTAALVTASPWTESRLDDANCTCLYKTPTKTWAISYPGGCNRPCDSLPDYDALMAELRHETAVPQNATTGDLGFPPWQCGTTSTGSLFISCDDALRVEQWVYCHEDCRCQAAFQLVYDSQCPSTPHHNTNCGTTCVCWGSVRLNPFAMGCDCDTVSAACEAIPVCDSYTPCNQEDQKRYAKEWLDMGCASMNENNVGVSPGRARYQPDSCAWDLGCDLSTSNTGAPNQCPPPPPRIQTGTTGSGDYGDPGGLPGSGYTMPKPVGTPVPPIVKAGH